MSSNKTDNCIILKTACFYGSVNCGGGCCFVRVSWIRTVCSEICVQKRNFVILRFFGVKFSRIRSKGWFFKFDFLAEKFTQKPQNLQKRGRRTHILKRTVYCRTQVRFLHYVVVGAKHRCRRARRFILSDFACFNLVHGGFWVMVKKFTGVDFRLSF